MEKCPDQVAIQGRLYADNPDQAAQKAREKHPKYKGKLSLKPAFGDLENWYEYIINKEW